MISKLLMERLLLCGMLSKKLSGKLSRKLGSLLSRLSIGSKWQKALLLLLSLGLQGVGQVSWAKSAEPSVANIFEEQRKWAGLSTKTATVSNINWVYSEGGEASKPPILLLHVLAGSRDNWNMVAAKLTPYYHVIIPDLPAHGDTVAPEDYDYQIPELTTSVRRFVEAIGVEKNLHVAGHSLGGGVALLYSSMYFLDIQSLLLVDSAGIYKTTTSPYSKDLSKAMNELMVQKKGDLAKTFKIVMEQPPFVPQYILDAYEQQMIAGNPKLSKLTKRLAEMNSLYTTDEFYLALRAVETPTMLLWGEKDKIFDVAAVAELQGQMKNVKQVEILPAIGHMAIMEADQIVAERYLKFLRGPAAAKNVFMGTN